MAKREKKQMAKKEPSLRDKIKEYRRNLHGEFAMKFDEIFIESCGLNSKSASLKQALQDGKDLQKAFVAAKKEIEKMPKFRGVNDDIDEDDDEYADYGD